MRMRGTEGTAGATGARRQARVVVVAVLAAVLVALLLSALGRLQGRAVHGDGEGPMSILGLGQGGGVGIYSKDMPMPWTGAFGYILPCLETGGVATIQDVRWTEEVRPRSLKVMVRRVSDEEADLPFHKRTWEATPFFSVTGTPPDWSEPYADSDIRGSFSEEVSGLRVANRCRTGGRERGEGFTELVLVMEAGRRGAEITELFIDYEHDGRQYTHRTEHRFYLCGDDVKKGGCRKDIGAV
jgi:hypothetical protein